MKNILIFLVVLPWQDRILTGMSRPDVQLARMHGLKIGE